MVINMNLFKKYDVALSFAEENREVVDRIAQLLKAEGIKVFYDQDFRHASWGKDLKSYLDKVYRLQARFCVVFVSEEYERKQWTNFEKQRADARSFQQNRAYVLPYLLDDSPYAGQFKEIACLTHKTDGESTLVEAVKEQIEQQPGRRLVVWIRDLYKIKSRLLSIAALFLVSLTILLKDHFTPVDTLAKRIYNQSQRKVSGSVCRDSSFSLAQGQGACSHHGGVAHLVDSTMQEKTFEQCRKEAEEISWLPP